MADFLTAEQVAKMLSVPIAGIYRLIKNGELPVVRIGKSYRINKSDVDAFIGQGGTMEKESFKDDQPNLGNAKKTELPVAPATAPDPVVATVRMFTTRDMWEAAILMACGHTLVAAEYSTSLARMLWDFEDTENLRLDLADHYNGKLTLPTMEVWRNWQNVKKRVRGVEGGGAILIWRAFVIV